jgi:hypothetical protein
MPVNQPVNQQVDPPATNLVSPGLTGPRSTPQQGWDPPYENTLVEPGGMLWGWGCSISYQWDYGLRPTAPAAPFRSTLLRFVRVHTGVCFKICDWVAQSLDVKPAMPQAVTDDPNEVLLWKVISPAIPGKLQDGTPVWTIAGSMTYALQLMPSETDSLQIGSTPFGIEPVAQNVLNPQDFKKYLGSAQVSGFYGQPITF